MEQYQVNYTETLQVQRTVEAVVECDDGDPVRRIMAEEFVKFLPKKFEVTNRELNLEGIQYRELT